MAALAVSGSAAASGLERQVARLAGARGVVYVVDDADHVLLEVGRGREFIPASTLKTFTTLLAARYVGLEARFRTEFFLDGDLLVVRGRGDPFLISEEIEVAAAELARRLDGRRLAGIAVDDSYFAAPVVAPGVSRSTQPYDAINTATAVNFNTIFVTRIDGRVVSAEAQTPLTPLAVALAGRHRVNGKTRINLSERPEDVRRYAGELIAAKLRAAGVTVGDRVEPRLAGATPFYVHENSRTLADVCREMLYHSNNYVANQVFLAAGASASDPPATLEKGVAAAESFIAAHPRLRDLVVHEGSGLSYDNRATGPAMAEVLKLFAPHRHLLRQQDGVPHKTGSLRGAAALVGYLDTARHGTVRFVIGLDGSGTERRWQIVEVLRREL